MMKYINPHPKIYYITFLFIILSLPLYAQTDGSADTTKTDYGYLTIKTLPDGLIVLSDSKKIGITPILRHKLPVGTHQLSILHPDRKGWQSLDITQETQIHKERITDLFFKMGYTYSFVSEPYDADIFYRGVFLGTTPLHYNHPERMKGTLSIKKEGYQTFIHELKGNEAFPFIKAILEPNINQRPDLSRFSSTLKQSKDNKKRLPLYSAITSGVVFGALSFYFKDRADIYFDRYSKAVNNNSDVQLQGFYLNRTSQFDNYSTISLILSQVSLGISTYILLKE